MAVGAGGVLLPADAACRPDCVADKTGYTVEFDGSLELPELVENGISRPNIGVAGAFAGVVGNRLLVAGGANFPDGFPWTGATKVWHRDLYLYDFSTKEWKIFNDFLPQPAAYGLSFRVGEGILIVGGNNADGGLRSVNLISMEKGKPTLKEGIYPDLPFPLSNAAGDIVGSKIYIAGGIRSDHGERSSHTFLTLDLADISAGWQELKGWPGPDLGFCVAAGCDDKFYLFGGRDFGPDKELTINLKGYEYDPLKGEWSELPGEFPVMAGTAAGGDGEIWFFGGVEKILPTDPNHPGFPRKLRRYSPSEGRLETVAESPYPIAVTTTCVPLDPDSYIVASGEERPGVRTPLLLRIAIGH